MSGPNQPGDDAERGGQSELLPWVHRGLVDALNEALDARMASRDTREHIFSPATLRETGLDRLDVSQLALTQDVQTRRGLILLARATDIPNKIYTLYSFRDSETRLHKVELVDPELFEAQMVYGALHDQIMSAIDEVRDAAIWLDRLTTEARAAGVEVPQAYTSELREAFAREDQALRAAYVHAIIGGSDLTPQQAKERLIELTQKLTEDIADLRERYQELSELQERGYGILMERLGETKPKLYDAWKALRDHMAHADMLDEQLAAQETTVLGLIKAVIRREGQTQMCSNEEAKDLIRLLGTLHRPT
jgi:hypothetical protein